MFRVSRVKVSRVTFRVSRVRFSGPLGIIDLQNSGPLE